MSVPKYVKWLYNIFGKKAQGWYDDIDSWDLPDWLKDASEKMWDKLDDTLRKKLYDLAVEICKKFDGDFAKQLLEDIWKKIQEKLNI